MKSFNRSSRSVLLVLAALALALTLSATAFAAPVAQKAKVIRAAYVGTVSQSMFMANLEFPADVTLPVEVEVAIPRGAVISWFGEILGADPSQDKSLNYKKTDTRGVFDIYSVTLVNSRIVQVEAGVGMPVEANGAKSKITLSYAPAQDADELLLAAELPKTAEVDLADGIAPIADGGAGGQVYGVSINDVKAGEEKTATVNYEIVSSTKKAVNDTLKGKLPMQTVILIVMFIAALALLVGIFIVSANKKSSASEDNDFEDGDYDYYQAAEYNGEPVGIDQDVDANDEFDFDNEYDDDIEEDASSAQAYTVRDSAPAKQPMKTNQKLVLITVVVALLGIAAIVAAGLFTDRPTVNNGVYAQEFAQGDACADVEFSLTADALANPEAASKELFSTLKKSSVPVLTGKLDTNTNTLIVGYCESQTNGQAIEQVLAGNRLVGPSNVTPRNVVVPSEDGSAFWYYFTETGPCVVNEIEFSALPNEDPTVATEAIAKAIADIPSLTAILYYPAGKTAQVGYCDEQATDADIIAALNAAGLNATIKSAAQAVGAAE